METSTRHLQRNSTSMPCTITLYYGNSSFFSGREPLKINTQPIEQEVFYTQEVALSVSATGAGTIMYEWMKDGSSIATLESTDFTAADSPILRISHFSKKHEGKYSCVVRNQDNTLDSHTVNLRGITLV